MESKKIQIPATSESFLNMYLNSINGLLRLTPKEMKCLQAMLELNVNYTGTKEIRKELVDILGLKSVHDVTNLIKFLKDKKIIFKNKEHKRYDYNPIVVPTSKIIQIEFKIS